MREDIAGLQGASSRPPWEMLEGMVREKAQEFIQQIMEEGVTELFGWEKSGHGCRVPESGGADCPSSGASGCLWRGRSLPDRSWNALRPNAGRTAKR